MLARQVVHRMTFRNEFENEQGISWNEGKVFSIVLVGAKEMAGGLPDLYATAVVLSSSFGSR